MELVASIFVAVLIVELYAWLPDVSERLLELAVSRLPAEDQERCREEWKAQLGSLPNTVVRLLHALSLMMAAERIHSEVCREEIYTLHERINNLLETHYRNIKRVAEVRRLYADGREDKYAQLRKSHETVREMNWDLTNPSFLKLHNVSIGFLRSLDIAFKRSDVLADEMIARHEKQIERTENMINQTFNDYMTIYRRFHRTVKSLKPIRNRIKEIEKTLTQIEISVEHEIECSENDEPLAEFKRITSALQRVCGKNVM